MILRCVSIIDWVNWLAVHGDSNNMFDVLSRVRRKNQEGGKMKEYAERWCEVGGGGCGWNR